MRLAKIMAGKLSIIALLAAMTPAEAQQTVRRGDTGANVTRLQEALKRIGYNLTVDGRFGASTERAVRELQEKNRLSADGVVGARTWQLVNDGTQPPAVTTDRKLELKWPRMFGDDVRSAQEQLNKAGFRLRVDGEYGTGTEEAVREFQRRRGLTQDGKIGARTWQALRG